VIPDIPKVHSISERGTALEIGGLVNGAGNLLNDMQTLLYPS
jgi:hypothetical protein